ncbi:MAG: Reverse transcriptase (RNA-dependent DNA polymerase) [Firmicutes bacterium ADurb.Bin419]|nr:MAG: Reverse transcriptase (RNA-dependent DNA polymerase) [Firmicutes bacterium ADurb.Bin419]
MDYLKRMKNPMEWEKYYTYCESSDHIGKRDLRLLREYIDEQKYSVVLDNINNHVPFPYPRKYTLNKMGVGKKRIVYTYDETENYVLKMLAFLLHDKDKIFAENLFSFRHDQGVRKAIASLVNKSDISNYYSYKLDIHDYFNSVDVGRILSRLRKVLQNEECTYMFIEEILLNPYVISEEGIIIEETKGIMAGVPISSFLANLYLTDLDWHFQNEKIIYARYSDDIVVFAKSKAELEEYREFIERYLISERLTLNPKKICYSEPNRQWNYLGIKYISGVVDISDVSLKKMKGKLRRKARTLYRWKIKNKASDERALRAYIRAINNKLYNNPNKHELTWTRWFFPLINTSESLHKLDTYMLECIRYIATGKHTKANYNIRYHIIKEYGYKSLVNAFYKELKPLDAEK